MKDIISAIEIAFNSSVYKLILSNLVSNNNTYKKVIVNKKDTYYQMEKYTDTQVFHENLSFEEVRDFLISMLRNTYKQCNSWDDQFEYSVRLSNKGKVFFNKKSSIQTPKKELGHNRKKDYILSEGTLIEPLVDMGILTKEGKVVNAMYDKYKQINRFVEIIDDEISKMDKKYLTVIDFGSGKSYLTFVLYYYFTQVKHIEVKMIGLDLKKDVVEHCNQAAKRYGYSGLSFQLGDIKDYKCDFPLDMVITLHACDTATDYALYNAIKWDANLIFSVPCCQHELKDQIDSENLSLFTHYGIIKERTAALLTDAIRGNLLVYCGYKTQLLEFIDLEHTPKNILIRGRKANISTQKKTQALEEVKRIMDEFKLHPTLYELLFSERIS